MDVGVRGSVARTYADAVAAGLKTYFTGKACRNGHVVERRTRDKRCLQCADAKWKRRYAIHAGLYKAASRRRYKLKTEIWKEDSRRWYHENLAEAKERRKRYYYENREALIAAAAQWAKENPVRAKASRTNVKAKRLSLVGRISAEDIMALMENQGGMCFCGVEFLSGFTIDHIMPISKGGHNMPDNIQLLCLTCNLSKGTRLDAEWKAARGFSIDH